jgi:hypothetical protein
MKDYFEEEKEKIDKKKLKEMSKEQVGNDIFKKGLSCLGKTFNNGRHAYLNLNISNNNLVSIVVWSLFLTVFFLGYREVQIPPEHRCLKQQAYPFEGSLSPEALD